MTMPQSRSARRLRRRILHATDFSPASRAAFAKALDLARQGTAELLIVHVMVPVMPDARDAGALSKTWKDLERATKTTAQRSLDRLLAAARKAGVRAAGLLLDGPPAEAIVRAARSKGADMLVLGTHGRTGFARFFLGSVASRVTATASCPVLTVQGKAGKSRRD
jgi:nucleotide-binding universal stress UspA family protein